MQAGIPLCALSLSKHPQLAHRLPQLRPTVPRIPRTRRVQPVTSHTKLHVRQQHEVAWLAAAGQGLRRPGG